MASPPTRSSRRAEGLAALAVGSLGHDSVNSPSNPNTTTWMSPPRKRPRSSSARDGEPLQAKKHKVNGDIAARPKVVEAIRPVAMSPTPARVIHHNTNQADVSPPKHQQQPQSSQQQPAKAKPNATLDTSNASKHESRARNGSSKEANGQQQTTTSAPDDKRKLRSQEGARFKSELSAYFPDYDEVIGNEEKKTYLLEIDTPLTIIDSKLETAPPSSTAAARQKPKKATPAPVRVYKPGIFDNLHQTTRIEQAFAFLDKHIESNAQQDLLPDSYYETAHRRAERLEKSIRNTEKGRAQHERDQVVRLLEGLQGHDWLRVMGVSGITDSKKKEFEPARDHFIKGCEGILERFKAWKEEEKRRKAEKDRARAAEEEEEEDGDDDEEDTGEEEDDGEISDGDPPDYSDVDASAARQLHEEALARTRPPSPVPKLARKKPKFEQPPPPPPEPPVYREFRSFFRKPHLREAALRKNRRSGRTVLAWGEPVPEPPEAEFYLPEEYRDEEFMKAHARRRRRFLRESREKSRQ